MAPDRTKAIFMKYHSKLTFPGLNYATEFTTFSPQVKYNHTEVTAALKTCLIITNTQNLTATQVASQQGAATGLIKAFEKKYV
jgi:hypothetical protein